MGHNFNRNRMFVPVYIIFYSKFLYKWIRIIGSLSDSKSQMLVGGNGFLFQCQSCEYHSLLLASLQLLGHQGCSQAKSRSACKTKKGRFVKTHIISMLYLQTETVTDHEPSGCCLALLLLLALFL